MLPVIVLALLPFLSPVSANTGDVLASTIGIVLSAAVILVLIGFYARSHGFTR